MWLAPDFVLLRTLAFVHDTANTLAANHNIHKIRHGDIQ